MCIQRKVSIWSQVRLKWVHPEDCNQENPARTQTQGLLDVNPGVPELERRAGKQNSVRLLVGQSKNSQKRTPSKVKDHFGKVQTWLANPLGPFAAKSCLDAHGGPCVEPRLVKSKQPTQEVTEVTSPLFACFSVCWSSSVLVMLPRTKRSAGLARSVKPTRPQAAFSDARFRPWPVPGG